MIKQYLLPALFFALGVYCLTQGKRKPKTSIWLSLLLSALAIWYQKTAVEMLLFLGLFIPVLYVASIKDERAVKSRHSSIQEKAIAYVAILPTFGFYFLFKENIEEQLSSVGAVPDFIKVFELLILSLTVVGIYSFQKNRGKLC